jgi:hypothetical protein
VTTLPGVVRGDVKGIHRPGYNSDPVPGGYIRERGPPGWGSLR